MLHENLRLDHSCLWRPHNAGRISWGAESTESQHKKHQAGGCLQLDCTYFRIDFIHFPYIYVVTEALVEWKANNVVLCLQALLQLPLGLMSLHYMLTYAKEDIVCQVQDFFFQFSALSSLAMDLLISLCYLLMLSFR